MNLMMNYRPDGWNVISGRSTVYCHTILLCCLSSLVTSGCGCPLTGDSTSLKLTVYLTYNVNAKRLWSFTLHLHDFREQHIGTESVVCYKI